MAAQAAGLSAAHWICPSRDMTPAGCELCGVRATQSRGEGCCGAVNGRACAPSCTTELVRNALESGSGMVQGPPTQYTGASPSRFSRRLTHSTWARPHRSMQQGSHMTLVTPLYFVHRSLTIGLLSIKRESRNYISTKVATTSRMHTKDTL
jgi:hypothetical protein